VAQTTLFQSLRTRARKAAAADDLAPWLDRAKPLLERLILPAAIVHRDFGPWNLRLHQGELGAFDWECAELDGPPLVDQFHHLLLVAYFLERQSAEQAARRLLRTSESRASGLAPAEVIALQVVCLIDHLVGLLEDGYSVSYPKFIWWRTALSCVAAAMDELLPRVPDCDETPANGPIRSAALSAFGASCQAKEAPP
jgi:hypothetical protein